MTQVFQVGDKGYRGLEHCAQLTQETLQLCDKIATFSAKSERIERFCLSEQMDELHAYLQEYFKGSLSMQRDAVGNVLFVPVKSASASEQGNALAKPAKRVLIGSHLDTVSNAGKYDGIIGVVMGLLCARDFSNEEVEFHSVGFADEEGGRFGCRFLGSLNFIGALPEDYLSAKDTHGVSLGQAMLTDELADFSDYLDEGNTSFLELHIEQGLALHEANQSLGVVEQICGQAVLSLHFKGRTAHAVSKYNRQDALLSACELVAKAYPLAGEIEDLHMTFGYIKNSPNQSNVVSDRTEVRVDVRHTDDSVRAATIKKIIALADEVASARNTQLSTELSEQQTVQMDKEVVTKLHHLCQEKGIANQLMTSFAGHDALVMSRRVPTGFIFLRDDKGISHHPQESVEHQAITDAFSILATY